MTNKKSTKKALILSVLSLVLCFSMLVGTTFAWFTDSVTSANNIIASGNLDVELEYWDGDSWEDVADATVLTNKLWEPGVVEVAYLRVANAGSLAFKYQLGININSEKPGTNVAGKSFKLSDYIQFGVVEGVNGETGAYATREAAVAAVTDAKKIATGYTKASTMTAGQELYLALVVYMPETVGNEANHNGTDVPQIDLGINIVATQTENEEDAFGSDYDENAPWCGEIDVEWYDPDATEYVINSAEELAGLAAIVNGTATAPATTYAAGETAVIKDNFKGKTIKLGKDIDLNDVAWTPIGDNANPFLGNFDGQGHTVSNLYVVNDGWAGLIGHAGKAAGSNVANVTIDGATILSNRMAGAVVGQIYGSIDNCHVKNATIIATPNAVGDSYDNGDKVGGIVGWLGDNGNNRTLSNCTAENVELGAYRDVGGIAGYVASSTTVKDNAVADITITVDQSTNYYGDKDVNAGYICGRVNGTITEENNTCDEDSVVDSTYSKNGITYKADGEGNVVLYLVPETYEGTTVTVPEGVTAIGNYAFAYNTNVETVVLASTVRDLGRGFDSSTVKKVVLNEGLTTISSRAFRSTTALEEVVFSSTVTEIADNAFQKSAIKEIVIPASVTTIGETAFGASLIEKVTFEGNTAIQGYAFRGCTKLREVILKGDDVTFVASTLNGRNSCWFCNGESNNPKTSNITFTVVSEEIKERVLTAMGAERNNTTVIVDDGFEKVETVDALLEALENATAGTKINATGVVTSISELGVVDGSYTTLKMYGGTTIKGATISFGSNTPILTNGSGEIVFENCTFTSGGFSDSVYFQSGSANVKVVFKNCTFAAAKVIVADNNGNGVEYNNCTFSLNDSGYGLVQAMGGNHTFNNCSFNISGSKSMGSSPITKYGQLNMYSERFSTTVTVNQCTGVPSVFRYAASTGTNTFINNP